MFFLTNELLDKRGPVHYLIKKFLWISAKEIEQIGWEKGEEIEQSCYY
jgi:hypothetical protein